MTFREDRTAWLNVRIAEVDAAIKELESGYGHSGGSVLYEIERRLLEDRRQTLVARKRGM